MAHYRPLKSPKVARDALIPSLDAIARNSSMPAPKPLSRQLSTHASEEVRTLRIPYGTSALPGARIRAMARLAAASFDAEPPSIHNLKREAINTAKDCRVHPSQLKQLGQHATYATFGAYLEVRRPVRAPCAPRGQ
jgi:hypothetical protein